MAQNERAFTSFPTRYGAWRGLKGQRRALRNKEQARVKVRDKIGLSFFLIDS